MSIKSNLKQSLINLASASTQVVMASSELVLETSNRVVRNTHLLTVALPAATMGVIDQVVPIAKEVGKSPLTAYSGYLIEHEGITAQEAEKIAYAVLEEDVAHAIKKGSQAVGILLAKASEGWDFEEEEVSTK